MNAARAVTLVSLLSVGCFSDYIVAPPTNQPSRLGLAVSHRQAAGSRYSVEAYLDRGRDGEGNPRAFVDSTLIVDGAVVHHVSLPSSREVGYRWADSASGSVRDSVVVRTPAVQGDTVVTLRLPMRVRDGPYLIDHVAGADLVLRVVPAGDTIPGFRRPVRFWNLDVRDARSKATVVSIHGLGSANLLPFPPQLVPAAAGDSLEATLTTNAFYPSTVVTVGVAMYTTISWMIRVRAP